MIPRISSSSWDPRSPCALARLDLGRRHVSLHWVVDELLTQRVVLDSLEAGRPSGSRAAARGLVIVHIHSAPGRLALLMQRGQFFLSSHGVIAASGQNRPTDPLLGTLWCAGRRVADAPHGWQSTERPWGSRSDCAFGPHERWRERGPPRGPSTQRGVRSLPFQIASAALPRSLVESQQERCSCC